MKEVKVQIVGFGTVGRGFADVVQRKRKLIRDKFKVNITPVGVSDSQGVVVSDNLDLASLIDVKINKGSILHAENSMDISSVEMIRNYPADIVVEVTPTNIDHGEPGLTHFKEAFKNGKHVVTANKGPLAIAFKELVDLAEKNNRFLRYEGSVGGGMPVFNLVRECLQGNILISVKGIINGTTNFILSKMTDEKMPFDIALKEAQKIGIAEADPTYDIEGIDAGCKLVILANGIFGLNKTIKDVSRQGISGITPEDIESATKKNCLIKHIASISENGELKVSPQEVQKFSSFAVGGTLNVLEFKTDIAKDITVIGRGAGGEETASAILSDVINIELQY